MNKIASFLLCAGLCLGLAAGCATTQAPQTSNLTATEESAEAEPTMVAAASEEATEVSEYDEGDPDEVICKTKQATGTRIKRVKDCRTRAQWKAATSNAQRSINSLRDRQCFSGTCNAAGGDAFVTNQ